jgi:hypothetical protein
MEIWYEGVAARLKMEADEEAARARRAAEPGPRTSSDMSGDGSSADERKGAFKYFEDPMYRKARPRPPFMRHVSKQEAIYPMDDRGGKSVASRVRHMISPFSSRKKSIPGRYESDSLSDEDATPVATNPPQSRYGLHKRPHPPRRDESVPSTDSDSDEEGPPTRRRTPSRTPDLRPQRSYEPPREYFPTYYESDRRSSQQYYPSERPSSKATSPQPMYGPTKSPLFATHVAQMEARNYHDRRPVMPPRTNYRPAPQNVRYSPTVPVSPPREVDPLYTRDHHRDYHHDRDRERDRDRDRDRDRETVAYDIGTGNSIRSRHRRRSTEDAAYPRERERERDTARTRSHDRVKDDWDDRDVSRERDKNADWDDRDHYDRSRDHSRERDRDRDRRTHRYVPGGLQDGVSGRRYPVV